MQAAPQAVGITLANWNWKVVRLFAQERLGQLLSRSSCFGYLHRLGFVLKRPKKRLLRADASKRTVRETCTAETSVAFLQQLRSRYSGPLIVIWDKGLAHRGPAIRGYLTTPGLNLRLIALPAYSPDFNPDEAIWDWAHEEVTANTCFGTAAKVREHLDRFWAGLAERPLGFGGEGGTLNSMECVGMRRRSLRIALCMLLGAVVVGLYLYGTSIQLLEVNVISRSDQGGTLGYAKDLATSHYSYIGDRNRMPLYPLLVSVFFRQGMSDAEYFWVGKVFNIALSLPLLVGLFATVARHVPRWQAANFVLVYMFTICIFRAAYAQCELFFYFLNLSSFLLLSWFLVRPNWHTGLAAGLLLA